MNFGGRFARMRRVACLSLLLAAVGVGVDAQPRVYKWVDANGVVHFSDAPPEDGTAQTVVVPSTEAPAVAPRPPANTRTPVGEADTAPQAPAAATPPARPSAPDCSTQSPAKRAGLDLYAVDEEPPLPLSSEQIETFERVAKTMAHRWSGNETGFACEAGVRQSLNRTIVSEGRAESALQFVLESTITARDRSHREPLRIAVRNERLWVNQGDASLLDVSERGLEFGYRERVGGAVSERYWRITLDGRRGMKIERAVYTNGAMLEATVWELSKAY